MSDPLGLISSNSGVRGPGASPVRTDPANGGDGFRKALEAERDAVNQLEKDAKEATEDFVTGKRDMESVILATEKADMAFGMLLQVRNKVMDALEEVKQVRV